MILRRRAMGTALQNGSQDAARCHSRPSSAGLDYFRKHLLFDNAVTTSYGQRDPSLVPRGACAEVTFSSTGAEAGRRSVLHGSATVEIESGRRSDFDCGCSNITRKRSRKVFLPQRPESHRNVCVSSAMEKTLDPVLGGSVHVQVKSRGSRSRRLDFNRIAWRHATKVGMEQMHLARKNRMQHTSDWCLKNVAVLLILYCVFNPNNFRTILTLVVTCECCFSNKQKVRLHTPYPRDAGPNNIYPVTYTYPLPSSLLITLLRTRATGSTKTTTCRAGGCQARLETGPTRATIILHLTIWTQAKAAAEARA